MTAPSYAGGKQFIIDMWDSMENRQRQGYLEESRVNKPKAELCEGDEVMAKRGSLGQETDSQNG